MQLLFTIDELQLVANVIQQRTGDPDFQPDTNRAHAALAELLEKLIARRMSFDIDELESMQAVLTARKAAVQGGAAMSATDRALLERALDKVTEACVMM